MAFEKDLGYLDAFLGKIRAFAGGLDPARGARLQALMDEEVARWAEIRALLGDGAQAAAAEKTGPPAQHSGAAEPPAQAPTGDAPALGHPAAEPAEQPARRPEQPARRPERPAVTRWTVGALRDD